MSFTTELDVYGEMVSDGMIVKSFTEEEPEQCITLPKREHVGESLVVGEEIVVGANGHLPNKINCQTEATMYFEESLENCDEMAVDYEEPVTSIPLAKNLISEKWDCGDMLTSSKESESEEVEGDEETIATFVTAAGQQLALYAVEDSDDIFAVAVYDESGEPPSNFQFLMKADVERLIGEGAVRTVKKPMQMKKRLLTTQPPMFYCKEEFEEMNELDDKISIYDPSIDSEKSVVQEQDCEVEHNYKIHQNYGNSAKINSISSDNVHITADEQSDIAYLMMDNSSVNVAEQPDESQDNCESENELVERSTVQYILLEGDCQSDSELTFDEIQATLQNLKTSRGKVLERDDDKFNKSQDDDSPNIQQTVLRDSSIKIESANGDIDELDFYISQSMTDRHDMCVTVSEYDRQQLIDALTDSPPSTATTTMANTPLKVKRSRKQQLTSVNRDDGEIIIQPASMLSEEELVGKKRSRRRPRLSSQMRANGKRMKRRKRRRVVEVIDLETDEEEQQTKRNVVEITLDDSKDQYSSDKENEIIMVRDSDSDNGDDEDEEEEEEEDEEEEEEEEQSGSSLTKLNGLMQCEHCSRNFRQQRAFDTHLRICQKSPANALRLDERKSKDKEEEDQQTSRKQYACKICQEKFDVVVALARHVRAAHSQRKKHKSQDKSLRSVQHKEITSTEEEEEFVDDDDDDDDDTVKRDLSMLTRVKRKQRKQRSNCSWETKKLSCADCGRWFPSSALLDAHSLQHGTKKSEQLRKCHICKKLIRSRLLFLRHLKMHEAQRNTSSSPRMLRRKLRPRPSARKIPSSRKRGRPRKF